jgi:hypothetical protein
LSKCLESINRNKQSNIKSLDYILCLFDQRKLPDKYPRVILWREWDLDPRPRAYESPALPLSYLAVSREKVYYIAAVLSTEYRRPAVRENSHNSHINSIPLMIAGMTNGTISYPRRKFVYDSNDVTCNASGTIRYLRSKNGKIKANNAAG